MSLGITSIWRARPLRLGPSIHGEPLFAFPRLTPYLLATRLRHSIPAQNLEALEKRNAKDSDNVKKSGAYKHRKSSENGADAAEETGNEETLAELREIEDALERSNFANSVLVPRYKDLDILRQRERSMRAHHKAVTAQVFHERTRVNVAARPVDWRMVLEDMAKSTPEYSLEYIEDGIKIDVDKAVLVRALKATSHENFGTIRRRTGATIKVSRDKSTLLLSGTRLAINSATEEIRNLAGRISVTRRFRPLGPGESETEELGNKRDFFIPPLSRDEGAYYKEKRTTQHADLVPMPTEWTAQTLQDYVISLVDTYFDPPLHSPTYTHTPSTLLVDHERAVTRRIMRLFSHLPSEASVSCSVVKLAMAYMTEKGDKYLPEVRSLLTIADRRGIPMDADVFNILLRAPVKTRNLRKFRQTLKNMTRRGFVPNLDTWLLFLRMFESVEVKYYILQAMNAKNMLGTPEIIQRIAQEMAPYDANHAVTQGKDLATFLQEQEGRYGRDWLRRDAGNKVLHVLGEYERYEDACKLLDLMGELHRKLPEHHTHERLATRPDATSFATIINHARIKGKVPLAVNVVRKMKTRKLGKQPTPNILHLLFELAWKARLRTTIVVIWRYASLAGLTSYRMRQRVAALLSGELGGPEDLGMTAKVYQQVGGETLARELVGGREVLESIKALCRRTWGKKYPRGKLGVIATKILPVAFQGFGPAVALGQVLSQSVLVDFKFLRARKPNQMRHLLASAQVKSLPLWQRFAGEERRADLAPLDPIEPAMIKHNDVWKDEWKSKGWIFVSRACISEEWREEFEKAYHIWEAKRAGQGAALQVDIAAQIKQGKFNEDGANDVEKMRRLFAKALGPLTEKSMVIINPMVWDDEKCEISAIGDNHRMELQRHNEKAILTALEQVSKDYRSFRYVFADDDSLSSTENEGGGENPVARDEIDEDEDLATSAENSLGRLQRSLLELKADIQEERSVHGSEEPGRMKPEEAKE